jgi:acyl carrier protein
VTSARSRSEILAALVRVLSDQIGARSASSISEDTKLFADLGLASIDAVVLSEALQKHYDRRLPFNELIAEIGRRTERDLSMGELISFLTANLGAPGAKEPNQDYSPA